MTAWRGDTRGDTRRDAYAYRIFSGTADETRRSTDAYPGLSRRVHRVSLGRIETGRVGHRGSDGALRGDPRAITINANK